MIVQEAVGILNRYRHNYNNGNGVSVWECEHNGRVCGIRRGHPETTNDDYLTEFEALAIANFYISNTFKITELEQGEYYYCDKEYYTLNTSNKLEVLINNEWVLTNMSYNSLLDKKFLKVVGQIERNKLFKYGR